MKLLNSFCFKTQPPASVPLGLVHHTSPRTPIYPQLIILQLIVSLLMLLMLLQLKSALAPSSAYNTGALHHNPNWPTVAGKKCTQF